MKKHNRKALDNGKVVTAGDSIVRADVVEAREIRLVSGTGNTGRSRLSIAMDSRGYPMIRMGDIDGPGEGVTKMIEIGFEVSSKEHWPYVKLSVGRGSWECSTMSVVDRDKNGKRETYPETSMHRQGNIRTYYKVAPSGEAGLELWGTDGTRYTITGHGPQSAHVTNDDRCVCDKVAGCERPEKRTTRRGAARPEGRRE